MACKHSTSNDLCQKCIDEALERQFQELERKRKAKEKQQGQQ